MKKPDIEQALRALDLIHSQIYIEKTRNPSITNKSLLIQVENVMGILGYNLQTKYEMRVEND